MTDIVDRKTRSRMMAGIRGKDTKPEMLIRRALHRKGFRYKLHDKSLPGTPDLVLPRYRAVIFVNGCFWHGHNCSLFKWPKTRAEFWREKIKTNRQRDHHSLQNCLEGGWRVLTVYECALRGPKRMNIDDAVDSIISWILGNCEAGVLAEKG